MFALLIPLLANAHAGKLRTPDVVEDALAFAQADRSKAIQLLESSFGEARRKEAGMIALHAGEQRRRAGDGGDRAPGGDHARGGRGGRLLLHLPLAPAEGDRAGHVDHGDA